MCGIYVDEDDARCAAMLSAMRYRGPDDLQVHRAAGLSVGFVRLAIVGLQDSGARQPHVTPKGRVVAFNGELYNAKQLGVGSEAEVLGELLDAGMDPRQHIDGDYAIVYYDPSNQKVTLYRDRFGMCSLYYQRAPYFAVSSERRKLQRPIEVLPYERVTLHTSGRVLKKDRLRHYGVTTNAVHGKDAAVKITEHLLINAVQSRASHSDVGFSIAISGGLDSTAVAMACYNVGLRPANAIVVAPHAHSEDLRLARILCKQLGWPLEEVILTPGMLEHARPHIMEHLDKGVVTALKWRASVRNWFVAQRAKSKVILCGEGADEVLCGYPPHVYSTDPLYRLRRQMSAVDSLPRINLDRTHKLGLAHSKEFRAPFLASTLSYWLLSAPRFGNKELLRALLRRWRAPEEICGRGKWSDDEPYLDNTFTRETA